MHDNHQEPSIWVRQATTIKGLVIFVLTMLLLIPTSMIESLIFERQGRQQEAVAEVSGKWGRQQNLAGPFLILPYEQTLRNSDGKIIDKVLKHAFYLPDALKINGQVQPELRHRGIFEVVLYSSALSLEGSFGKLQTDQFIPADAQILWEQAQLALSIPDLRGLKDQVKLDWDAQSSLFDPGIPVGGLAESGIHVPIPLQKEANGLPRRRYPHGIVWLFVCGVAAAGLRFAHWQHRPVPDPGSRDVFFPKNRMVKRNA